MRERKERGEKREMGRGESGESERIRARGIFIYISFLTLFVFFFFVDSTSETIQMSATGDWTPLRIALHEVFRSVSLLSLCSFSFS